MITHVLELGIKTRSNHMLSTVRTKPYKVLELKGMDA